MKAEKDLLPPKRINEPVALWIDEAGSQRKLDPSEFVPAAKQAGVTHLLLETVSWRGESILDKAEHLRWRDAAVASGMAVGAVVPLFATADSAETTTLSYRMVWLDDRWTLQQVTPPRLSPALIENRRIALERVRAVARSGKYDFLLAVGLGFEDLHADLGPAARQGFETWSSHSIRNWPTEILGKTPAKTPYGMDGRGQLWQSWMYWRADVLQRFLIELRAEVQAQATSRPIPFVVLVDAPFSAFQRQGLNWSSGGPNVAIDYPWVPTLFAEKSAGHLADAWALGYWEPSLLRRKDAEDAGFAWWSSLEGASVAARRALPQETPAWGVIPLRRSEKWATAVRVSRQLDGGVVLLDPGVLAEHPRGWELLRLALE